MVHDDQRVNEYLNRRSLPLGLGAAQLALLAGPVAIGRTGVAATVTAIALGLGIPTSIIAWYAAQAVWDTVHREWITSASQRQRRPRRCADVQRRSGNPGANHALRRRLFRRYPIAIGGALWVVASAAAIVFAVTTVVSAVVLGDYWRRVGEATGWGPSTEWWRAGVPRRGWLPPLPRRTHASRPRRSSASRSTDRGECVFPGPAASA
jgi:hypothetical protein